MATLLGAFSILFALAFGGYSVYAKLSFPVESQPPPGFTALIVSIAFFAGVQLVFLGVIGEYIGRIYEEVKGRPFYVVENVVKEPLPWTESTHDNTRTSTSDTGGGDAEKP